MSIADRKLRVFLCHSSQDKPVVREIYLRLIVEDWIDPWLDEEKLLPGQDWNMEIEKAVEIADVVIVCISNNSVTKEGYIQKEMKRILDKEEEKPAGVIYIIPLRLEICDVPYRLKKYQYLDFFMIEKPDLIYERLFASLATRASSLGINANKFKGDSWSERENKAKRGQKNKVIA
jgi:hypothetical protein